MFFRIVESEKPQEKETICMGQKNILTIIVEVWGSFFRTWDIVEDTTFWKKGKLSSEEKTFAYFFSHYGTQKPSVNNT